MKKNRSIPFGYCMKNGKIQLKSNEAKAVEMIFKEYLKGGSLNDIAVLMMSENIAYTEVSEKWNKNMVKRILENEKYLGNDVYPPLIETDIFHKANQKKQIKALSVNAISKELQTIRSLTYCTECGHRLSRIGGNTRSEKWDCHNTECYRFSYRMTDKMLVGGILNIVNTVISNPELLNTDTEISRYIPSLEITRQQNQINRIMDNLEFNYDKAREDIFRLAEMKYNCCTYNDKSHKTEALKSIIAETKELNTLDIDLLKSCVSRILVSHFCTIEIEFQNGMIIKNTTEGSDKNDYSTKCNSNSTKNTKC